MSESVRVPGFLPSTHGFHFANSWPAEPTLTIPFPTGPLRVGNAANGLCGGMAFAVRDYFEDGRPVPPGTDNPPPHTPLYDYIVRRLFDSFDIPAGIARFYSWQLPTTDQRARTVEQEWPRIAAALRAGQLVCLGLIRTRSFSPTDLGKNHQVLAYGFDVDAAGAVTLYLYDCNHPDCDAVTMTFATDGSGAVGYVIDGSPAANRTYGAFRQRYVHCSPGKALAEQVPEEQVRAAQVRAAPRP